MFVVFTEAHQLRTQVSGMLSQQSSSDKLFRESQQREMDLQVIKVLLFVLLQHAKGLSKNTDV